jgi:hypothetical protein
MGSTNRDKAFIVIRKQHLTLAFALLLIVLGLAACGLLSGESDTPTPVPTEATEAPTETPTPTEEPAPTGPPEAPTNLTAILSGAREVTLAWTDASQFEEGFIVVRALAETDDPGVEMGRPAQNATGFVDGSVECSGKYWYLVSAFNSLGVSEAVCKQVELPENCEDDTQPLVVTDCVPADEMETPTPMASGEGGGGTPVCGDGICNGAETNNTCAADCPSSCGNRTCDEGESFASCPGDCALAVVCNNDGTCDVGETPGTCGDCAACNNNGSCDAGENAFTCPVDCVMVITCNNNGVCDTGENIGTCPADCTPVSTCNNNGVCDAGESFTSCPADCALTVICNNNGVCDLFETASSCPSDCQ